MRRVAWVFVVLAGSGCARWSGLARARQQALREGLMEVRMPEGFRSGLANTSAYLDCRSGVECRAGVQNVWFGVHDGPEGGAFDVPETATERQVTRFWREVAPESYRAFEPQLERRALEKMEEEEAAFVPRWGLTAGVTMAVNLVSVPPPQLGVRVGVRRWWDIDLGWHLAVDYALRITPTEHRLGLRVGAEFTRFTPGRRWGAIGAPPWSISAFVGPRVVWPDPQPGLTTGIGALVTDWRMAPLLVELRADTVFAGQSSRVEYAFVVGFGL